MTSTAPLTGSHLRTYTTIFQHPVSHNLSWHDVHALLRHLGQVDTEANGNLKVTRNGQVLVLHPSRTKEVAEIDELMALRRFLQKSEAAPPAPNGQEAHWLLVIDHHGARIFRAEIHGGVPQKILPHEPSEHFREAPHAQDFSRRDQPDPNSFFEPIVKALRAGGPVLVFGSGTGKSSEMAQFLAWANRHHPELSKRIVGSQVVDEHHLTDGQLLAKAREFFAAPRAL